MLSNPVKCGMMNLKGFDMPAFLDLSGEKFGRLKVIERAKNNSLGKIRWICECDCGSSFIANRNELRSGDTESCGCLRKDLLRHDLVGQRFGRLIVKEQADKRGKAKSQFWMCLCDCGQNHIVSAQHLTEGAISSCGCFKEEHIKNIHKYGKDFFSNVEKTESCWNWKGRSSRGYGLFNAGKLIKAHRFSYIFYNRIIPKGKIICHSCDNPSCVNPGHLYAGTYKQNTQDMIQRNRQRKPKSLDRR